MAQYVLLAQGWVSARRRCFVWDARLLCTRFSHYSRYTIKQMQILNDAQSF